jgi:hypothetical protein
MVGCSRRGTEQTPVSIHDGVSIVNRVDAIRAEAKRIDASIETPTKAAFRRLRKDLTHWQFSGLLENTNPVFLSALFSEGQVVREETHYLNRGRLLFVRIETWWDVDDRSRAPEPRTRHDFYIDNDRTIRHVIQEESDPPTSKIDDTSRPATALVARSRLIAQILLGGDPEQAMANSLEVFADIDAPKP